MRPRVANDHRPNITQIDTIAKKAIPIPYRLLKLRHGIKTKSKSKQTLSGGTRMITNLRCPFLKKIRCLGIFKNNSSRDYFFGRISKGEVLPFFIAIEDHPTFLLPLSFLSIQIWLPSFDLVRQSVGQN